MTFATDFVLEIATASKSECCKSHATAARSQVDCLLLNFSNKNIWISFTFFFFYFSFLFSDFDGDDMIGVSDLREVIERLCGPELKLADSELQTLVQNVLEEADLDDDGALSFAEFEHIIDKSSDFCQ